MSVHRSKAEDRFARWLKSEGIRYEYEPQTFVLPNGERYTPDFWLPDIGVFVEVKSGDVSRLHKPWILAHIIPDDIQVYLWSYGRTWCARPLGWSADVAWARCRSCQAAFPTPMRETFICRACSGRDIEHIPVRLESSAFRKKDPIKRWTPAIPDKIAAGLL